MSPLPKFQSKKHKLISTRTFPPEHNYLQNFRIRYNFGLPDFPNPPNFRTRAQNPSAETPQSNAKRHPEQPSPQDDPRISGLRLPIMTGRCGFRECFCLRRKFRVSALTIASDISYDIIWPTFMVGVKNAAFVFRRFNFNRVC